MRKLCKQIRPDKTISRRDDPKRGTADNDFEASDERMMASVVSTVDWVTETEEDT